MSEPLYNSNIIYSQFVANSLFTPRQLSIILKRLRGDGKPENISSGAYYRQVKQCKKKVNSLLYTIVLLQSIGIVEEETLVTLSKLAEQLAVIFASDRSDITSRTSTADVILVINEVIQRMSRL